MGPLGVKIITESTTRQWDFTSVRVLPFCVLPSCAFLLYIMFYLSICMFYIDCTAEIKYILYNYIHSRKTRSELVGQSLINTHHSYTELIICLNISTNLKLTLWACKILILFEKLIANYSLIFSLSKIKVKDSP